MNSGSNILILGGGWGGLTVAHHLRSLIDPNHRIRVVERNATFSLGVSNLALMTGRRTVPEVRRNMVNLRQAGIEWIRAEVLSVDAATKTVETNRGPLAGDFLVLALGAELDPGSVPGFEEAAHNLYEVEGAVAIHDALERFDGGKVAVLVAGAPFRCPAAPYEAAMLVADWAEEGGIGDRVDIDLYTPESMPMAVTGPAIGEALCRFMDDRGISYHFNTQVTSVDPATKTLRFGDEEAVYDLIVGIPPHRAPRALREAGLTDSTGYVPVHPQTLELLSDPETLEVHYPGVYAIGDVAAIKLLNGMLLPKAGVFAEGEAQVVAAEIAAAINNGTRPAGFDGHGFCYVEVGGDLAAYGSGNFYAYPGPRVIMEEPTSVGWKAKQQFEDLLESWFAA